MEHVLPVRVKLFSEVDPNVETMTAFINIASPTPTSKVVITVNGLDLPPMPVVSCDWLASMTALVKTKMVPAEYSGQDVLVRFVE